MKDFKIRLNIKSKADGSLHSTYLPIASDMNGLNRWPVELDKWEILSTDRSTGIKIQDLFEIEWDTYEGDKITVLGNESKEYTIIFRDGIFGIEVIRYDFRNTLIYGSFASNPYVMHYHRVCLASKEEFSKELTVFIPLSYLNIGGTINGKPVVILTKY